MEHRLADDYERNVFINCPFDAEYKPLFDAIVFTVLIAGFKPRCSLETSNAGEVRIQKIVNIISECKYGVHDISRTELGTNGLPRFNMPLELGLDFGCRVFGNANRRQKKLLIMDRSPYRYQKFISDIAGQDIEPHGGRPASAIAKVRNWLSTESKDTGLPGGDYINNQYREYRKALPGYASLNAATSTS